jgi:hypothetical protein
LAAFVALLSSGVIDTGIDLNGIHIARGGFISAVGDAINVKDTTFAGGISNIGILFTAINGILVGDTFSHCPLPFRPSLGGIITGARSPRALLGELEPEEPVLIGLLGPLPIFRISCE